VCRGSLCQGAAGQGLFLAGKTIFFGNMGGGLLIFATGGHGPFFAFQAVTRPGAIGVRGVEVMPAGYNHFTKNQSRGGNRGKILQKGREKKKKKLPSFEADGGGTRGGGRFFSKHEKIFRGKLTFYRGAGRAADGFRGNPRTQTAKSRAKKGCGLNSCRLNGRTEGVGQPFPGFFLQL